MTIRLIIGLGNPGSEYQETRHNTGFWLIDDLSRIFNQQMTQSARFDALIAKISIDTQQIWLLEPQGFMNCSGKSVNSMAKFYKIKTEEILVVHDELDLPVGSIKLKKGGSSNGHNGLKDITSTLGSDSYWRLRIGIGHPRMLNQQQKVVDFVLQKPNKDEKTLIKKAIKNGLEATYSLCLGKFEQAIECLRNAD
jgi:PTH1 family peptidyl-tRNA hydrolase